MVTMPSEQSQAERWSNVERVLLRHHHMPDIEAARCLFSAFAAHGLGGSPVWAMLVAPPGCMKTELLSAIEGLPGVLLLDKLSPNTFISGQLDDPRRNRRVPASLLHRVGADGILVYPDFSTLMSMHRDHRASILADMRRIFDGHLRREFGTSENLAEREWRGRITFLVAATPDVDRYYTIFQTLGERFVMIRWHRPEGPDAAMKAMNQRGRQAAKDLKESVTDLYNGLSPYEPHLSNSFQHRIAALTEFVVRARTHVPRDSYGRKEITYVPEPEAPTRLAQQLAQLAKGSARLAGRVEVNEADYRIVLRCALDCIPAIRRAVLDHVMGKNAFGLRRIPKSTLSYAKEELRALEILALGASRLSNAAEGWVNQAGIQIVHIASPPLRGNGHSKEDASSSSSLGGDTP